MNESLINLMKVMAVKNMEYIEAEKDPPFPLFVFFRNQQRFIHLYLLSQECQMTSKIVREIMESMGREFTSQTYYGLRRELEQEGWIDYLSRAEANPTGRPGVVEMPHYVYRDKLSQFKKTIISSETVSRPVSVSKYHLFDMGMRFSDIQTLAQVKELQTYTQTLVKEYLHSVGEESADDAPFTLFYPDFIFRGMLEKVVNFATASISAQEELQTVMAGVLDQVRELQTYTQTLVKEYLHSVGKKEVPFTTLFYSDFVFRSMLEKLVEFTTAPISTPEELQTVMAGVFDRLPKVSPDHKESILSTLGGYVPPYVPPYVLQVVEKLKEALLTFFNKLNDPGWAGRPIRNELTSYLQKLKTFLCEKGYSWASELHLQETGAVAIALGGAVDYDMFYNRAKRAGIGEEESYLLKGLLQKACGAQVSESQITQPDYRDFLNQLD